MTLETVLLKNVGLIRRILKQWDSAESRAVVAKIDAAKKLQRKAGK